MGEHSLIIRDFDTSDGTIRVLSINRPEKRNALNSATIRALLDTLVAADEDESVRSVVLTGEGEHFCGGGDLHEFSHNGDDEAKTSRAQAMGELFLLPKLLGIPVIAAVRGAAVGGGAALMLAADMAVVGKDLRFAYPELSRSIVPSAVMVGLARSVGTSFAFELLTTGRVLTATDALERGMASRRVEPELILPSALGLAETLASIDASAMKTSKQLFYRGLESTDCEAMAEGMEIMRVQ